MTANVTYLPKFSQFVAQSYINKSVERYFSMYFLIGKNMLNDQKYYFLSALYSSDAPHWVRNPFMTKEQVIKWVKKMDAKQYGSIEIFDEETLKLEFYLKDTNNEFVKCNLREYLFDSRYSATCNSYESTKEFMINF